MLIKILTILSIIGIVISIMAIFIKTMSFIALGIANAICNKYIDIHISYKIPFFILLISVTTLACIIVL